MIEFLSCFVRLTFVVDPSYGELTARPRQPVHRRIYYTYKTSFSFV